MGPQDDRPEQVRRPRWALAAQLLVALGFGIAVLVLGGQAAGALDRPSGPVRKAIGSVTRTEPVRTAIHDVARRARAAAEPAAPASSRPASARGRERQPTARTVRVGLPSVDLRLDRDRVAVATTPGLPAGVTPIRLTLPSLLPGLPTVDLSVLGLTVTAGARADGAVALTPVVAEAAPSSGPTTISPAPAERTARPDRGTPSRSSRRPNPPVGAGNEGPLSTGVASAAGAALAILAVASLRRSEHPALKLSAALRRVPLAPTVRPSFTPD
jgi:hypothetical protein